LVLGYVRGLSSSILIFEGEAGCYFDIYFFDSFGILSLELLRLSLELVLFMLVYLAALET